MSACKQCDKCYCCISIIGSTLSNLNFPGVACASFFKGIENNSIKHPGTVSLLYTICLLWMDVTSPFRTWCARNTINFAYYSYLVRKFSSSATTAVSKLNELLRYQELNIHSCMGNCFPISIADYMCILHVRFWNNVVRYSYTVLGN